MQAGRDLINDCIRLLQKVLSDTYKEFELIHIAQHPAVYKVFSFRDHPEIPTVYGYVIDNTPQYLADQGVLAILSKNKFVIRDYKDLLSDTGFKRKMNIEQELVSNGYMEFTGELIDFLGYSFHTPQMKNIEISAARGLYYVVVDRKKARRWLNKYKDQKNRGNLSKEKIVWPENARIEGSKFIFDENNWVRFRNTKNYRFKLFKMMFNKNGEWVSLKKMEKETGVADIRRTLGQISEIHLGRQHSKAVSIECREIEGRACRRIVYKPLPLKE